MFEIEEKHGDLLFRIFVQPKSSKNMVAGIHGDALKVKITAPPVDGAANAMCIKFFSKLFGVPKSAIEIVSGQTGRNKRVRVATGGDRDKACKIRQLLDAYS
ncbi:hypothetical protein DSLASN_23900 [Desulfoluna limicola]|uniref:UPF0235 protein DSLASN_23900 n=1 Tax=Desulfoluna limicola TaxID=2810562 RepID=A0ABM7PI57_9BACT|nr:DUF167 family protein [Desulfoluna limicola]BCS96758.1 hypothetical protein DSLASN_23900 [Desulfoluna limicola]